MILLPGGGSLFEITKLTLGSLVKVIVLGLALRDDGETEKKGETTCKIQSRTSPPNTDSTGLWPVSYGPGVLLRFTFLEGTEKIHMFVLPPSKLQKATPNQRPDNEEHPDEQINNAFTHGHR